MTDADPEPPPPPSCGPSPTRCGTGSGARSAPDGATVSQLTNRLATNKGNVAHHVKVLVAAGLLAPEPHAHGPRRHGAVLRHALCRDSASPDGDRRRPGRCSTTIAEEVDAARDPLVNHRTVRLTRAQAEALTRHLERVVARAGARAGEREASYGVLVSVYRR